MEAAEEVKHLQIILHFTRPQFKVFLEDLIQLYNNCLILQVEHLLTLIKIKVKAKIYLQKMSCKNK